MEIAAEDTEDAENAEEGGTSMADGALDRSHPFGETEFIAGWPPKPPLLRVFRVIHVLRGNSYRRL